MATQENSDKTARRKRICFILLMLAAVGCAVIFAARAAEHTGMYWIGIDSEFTTESPEDNRGFFTVDVSDFLSAGAASAETAVETEVVPLAIGPIPSIPSLTEEELKLYEILSKNNGRVLSADKTLLEGDICWREVAVEPGDTIKSIAESYGVSEEDLRKANDLKKGEKIDPTMVLFVPNSGSDVAATLLFVKKLKKEELVIAKKSENLETSTYVVKEGDTLWGISGKLNLDVDTLIGSNKKVLGRNVNRLKPGMELRVPNQDGVYVTVAKNDTLAKITSKYGSTAEAIMRANGLESEMLTAGAEIFIPGGKLVTESDTRVASKSRRKRSGSSSVSSGSSRNLRWPVLGQISSPFGWRRSPFNRRRRVFHAGLDIRAPRGTPIRAAASGVVVHSGWMGGYGRAVVISHSKGLSTLYGHCSKLLVRNGAKISRGQTIALVGSTGRSTGNHLHFEVRVNGSPKNPLRHLR